MQPIEELRFLVLAAQRERSRLLAETLRPWHLTPPKQKFCGSYRITSHSH